MNINDLGGIIFLCCIIGIVVYGFVWWSLDDRRTAKAWEALNIGDKYFCTYVEEDPFQKSTVFRIRIIDKKQGPTGIKYVLVEYSDRSRESFTFDRLRNEWTKEI